MNKDALVVNPDQNLTEAWEAVLAQLKRATADRRHPFREVVLSTMDAKQRPNSRTVILRGFTEPDQIMIYTDIRSDKVAEIRSNPDVCLLFYHPPKKLQLKVMGEAIIHHQNNLSKREWINSGKHGAASYTALLEPGTVISSPDEAWERHESDHRHFCVILIQASSMEFLQLNGDQHLRSMRRKDEMQWIAP